MSDFKLVGRVVHHVARPRFMVVLTPTADGCFEAFGQAVTWIDRPVADVVAIASLVREAGEFAAANIRKDWLQEAVIARASELGLTSYAIAKLTGWAVSEDHVQAYLARRKSMGSHKLQHVLRALGLNISAD